MRNEEAKLILEQYIPKYSRGNGKSMLTLKITEAFLLAIKALETSKDNVVPTKKTNREMLANMSNKELASYLFNISDICEMCSNCYYNDQYQSHMCKDLRRNCDECIKEWLESEVEE